MDEVDKRDKMDKINDIDNVKGSQVRILESDVQVIGIRTENRFEIIARTSKAYPITSCI